MHAQQKGDYVGLVLESYSATAFLRQGEGMFCCFLVFHFFDLSCLSLVNRSSYSVEMGVRG